VINDYVKDFSTSITTTTTTAATTTSDKGKNGSEVNIFFRGTKAQD
jgi:hypothetical protein